MGPSSTDKESPVKITTEKVETAANEHEWEVFIDGRYVGSLYKSRPQRFSITHGVVYDQTKPWVFTFLHCGPDCRPIGNAVTLPVLNFTEAKRALPALLTQKG